MNSPSDDSSPDVLRQRLAAVAQLDASALDAEEIAVLGRKQGLLTHALKQLAALPIEEKRARGAALNTIKVEFEAAIAARRAELAQGARAAAARDIDLTMPGRTTWVGSRHPVSVVIDEIVAIFRELGFAVALGPEVENEERNFFALNFPPDHPALDMHDTLYLDAKGSQGEPLLLRTHTSPVQVRVMRAGPPPYRVVIPGLAYRNDPFDASHAPAFAQIEGLAIDEGVTFVDLKATLAHFARRFFGEKARVRFRPSFFPFTEPSAEMDISCTICGGSGCAACKHTGWLEILGCGMVHEKVLQNCGVDAERYTGFAFGMGPARIAMLRYGLPDIRLLYGGDMRFLTQFGSVGR
ncbi:MAG: phenylalanine--tRNA ligase subunit alpha [Gemmatimonadota bacterium]